MVCFASASPGSFLHTSSYGLHSDSEFLDACDWHPSFQEPWCYFQWVDRAAYTARVVSPYIFHSCSSYWDYRDAPFICCIIRATCFSDTYRVIGYTSPRADPDRFSFTSSDRGSDSSKLRIRGWCYTVSDRSAHLSAWLVCSCPADQPLGFGAWRQRGRGIEYVRPRGSNISWGAYDLLLLAFYVWYITMHSCLFSCIELHTCDCDIYVICVILMWYVTCVLSTLIFIYVMSLHYAHLVCFRALLRFKWALFLILMLISYLLSTTCWLGSYKFA